MKKDLFQIPPYPIFYSYNFLIFDPYPVQNGKA
jgi:hypothetical protein